MKSSIKVPCYLHDVPLGLNSPICITAAAAESNRTQTAVEHKERTWKTSHPGVIIFKGSPLFSAKPIMDGVLKSCTQHRRNAMQMGGAM